MTDFEKQLAEALRRIADPRNTHFAGDAQVVAREALAKFDAQAAEQAAGGGEAVQYPEGPIDVGFADSWPDAEKAGYIAHCLRFPACGYVHTKERIESLRVAWKLATNLAKTLVAAQPPRPAAPSEPRPKGVMTDGLYDNEALGRRECWSNGRLQWHVSKGELAGRIFLNGKPHPAWGQYPNLPAQAPAPAETPAAPVQQVGELLRADIEPRPLSYPLSDYHMAMTEGPLHYTWEDKPHRLVYDLIAAVRYYALSTRPELSDADLKRLGTIYSRSVLSGNGPDYAGMRDAIDAALAARGDKR